MSHSSAVETARCRGNLLSAQHELLEPAEEAAAAKLIPNAADAGQADDLCRETG
jgi:hypothetical protein